MINSNEIRAERARLGLTQKEMAEKIGCPSYQSYSKKERGEVQFTGEEWVKLSMLFGWSIEQSGQFLFGQNFTIKA